MIRKVDSKNSCCNQYLPICVNRIKIFPVPPLQIVFPAIPELRSMARTIRDKLDGIAAFWTFHHLTNASMEGFNNKIRWLIRQAYGFRDREYFKLKIFQLPEISSTKEV